MLIVLFLFLTMVGIASITWGIRNARKSVASKTFLELSLAEEFGEFSLPQDGKFSVWLKGRLLKKAPTPLPKPLLFERTENKKVPLYPVLFKTQVNDLSTSRIELFTFTAPKGNYLLVLSEGAELPLPLRIAIELAPLKVAEPEKTFFQIRENFPKFKMVLSILLIIFGSFLTLGGLIMTVLTLA